MGKYYPKVVISFLGAVVCGLPDRGAFILNTLLHTDFNVCEI